MGTTPSELNISAPIDYEGLKTAINQHGPLRLSEKNSPYETEISVVACQCAETVCDNEIVSIWRRNGLFSIHYLLSPKDLDEFQSLEHLKDIMISGTYLDSRSERLLIEQKCKELFGKHYSEVGPLVCTCKRCAEGVSGDALVEKMLIAQLSDSISQRISFIEDIREKFGDTHALFIDRAFDLGFAAGRIFSEYGYKKTIEPDALLGHEFSQTKVKRAQAAGQASASKRLDRIESLLSHLEKLISANPAMVRIPIEALAKLACDDARTENPTLWSQGAGQVVEYIGEIRRGEAGEQCRVRLIDLMGKVR